MSGPPYFHSNQLRRRKHKTSTCPTFLMLYLLAKKELVIEDKNVLIPHQSFREAPHTFTLNQPMESPRSAMATLGEGKRIFMTGASGYIGSRITEFAIAEGYSVFGLSRNEESDAKLKELGATPIRGNLETISVLTSESSKADIVINLADPLKYVVDKDYAEVVRIGMSYFPLYFKVFGELSS